MASSKSSSIRKAQIPSVCHLCESSRNIQWKCVDCDLLMCTNCIHKVHAKFKSSADHTVISIKEIRSESQQEETKIQTEVCEKHRKQTYSLFCSTCLELVCVDCITTFHKKHEFESLETVFDVKVSELKYYGDLIENEILPFLQADAEKLQKEGLGGTEKFNKAKIDIVEQQNHIKRLIDEQATKLIDDLKQSWNLRKEVHNTNIQQNEKLQDTMKHLCLELNETKNSLNIKTLNDVVTKIEGTLQNNDEYISEQTGGDMMEFTKGKISKDNIANMFGKLKNVTKTKQCFDPIRSYTTKYTTVLGLSVFSPDSAWIFDNGTTTDAKMLIQIEVQSGVKETKQFRNMNITCITLTPNGDLLMSLAEDTSVQIVRKSGKIEPFINVSPYLPRGLHVTKSNKVLIGMRERGPSFPLTEGSVRQIEIFDEKCKKQKQIIQNKKGTQLFSLPLKITSNVNGDICVVDSLQADFIGRLVVLGPSGDIRWTYQGNNDNNEFYPKDITTTTHGNIICSDSMLNLLHVLSMNGQLLIIQDTNNFGFDFPFSLDIDTNGLLWVGCTTSDKTPENAKLVILRLEGI